MANTFDLRFETENYFCDSYLECVWSHKTDLFPLSSWRVSWDRKTRLYLQTNYFPTEFQFKSISEQSLHLNHNLIHPLKMRVLLLSLYSGLIFETIECLNRSRNILTDSCVEGLYRVVWAVSSTTPYLYPTFSVKNVDKSKIQILTEKVDIKRRAIETCN